MQVGYGSKGSETIPHLFGKAETAARTISLFNGVHPQRLRDAGFAQTIANAAEAVVLHIGVAVFADQHHLVVSKGCQVFADLPAAIPVVSGYRVSGRRGAIDHRHRAIDIRDTRAAAGNDDHAIHSTLDQPVDGIRLHGDLAARVGDQNTVTGIDGCLFDGLRDLWEEWIGDIRQHQPENS